MEFSIRKLLSVQCKFRIISGLLLGPASEGCPYFKGCFVRFDPDLDMRQEVVPLALDDDPQIFELLIWEILLLPMCAMVFCYARSREFHDFGEFSSFTDSLVSLIRVLDFSASLRCLLICSSSYVLHRGSVPLDRLLIFAGRTLISVMK